MMKKAIGLLLCCFLFLLLPVDTFAMENDMLKVGLKYGDDALFTARLQNYNDTVCGSGYSFGYYDDQRCFVPILTTAEEKIAVTIDKNAYVSGSINYEIKPDHYSTVLGGYHIQLKTVFETFEEAETVAQLYNKAFVLFSDGKYLVRIGNHASREESENVLLSTDVSSYGAEIVSPSSTGVTVSIPETDTILFEFDCKGKYTLGILPLSVNGEKTVTWFNGNRYYGGFEYRRAQDGYISVINVVPIEDYVKCVIAAEMHNDWPLEALKAQTVCARTYAATQNRHAASGFDVCATTDCQAYLGAALCSEYSDAAADETKGVYIYYDGKVISNAVYYSCNGGASEDCKNVWGSDIPYLKGKADPYEESVAWRFSRYFWSFSVTKQEISDALKSKGIDIGTLKKVWVSERTENGNVLELTFEGSKGIYQTQRERCRTLLNSASDQINIRSMRFAINGADTGTYYINEERQSVTGANGIFIISGNGRVSKNSATGQNTYVITASGKVEAMQKDEQKDSEAVIFSGTGWGHNVGLSQWGAWAMAEQGYTYRDILEFYYTGITLS